MDNNSLCSGAVYKGTKNASGLAEQLVKRYFWRSGHCGIAIANESGYELLSSGKHSYAGYINSCPLTIGNDHTGLITAAKKFGSPYGTEGVITFKINGLQDRHLQIMWSVPFYTEHKINITIGPETASRELFNSMYSKKKGELVSAQYTCWNYSMKDGFQAMAMIGESGPAPFAILLKRNIPRNTDSI